MDLRSAQKRLDVEEGLENMGENCLNMYHNLSYALLVNVRNKYYPRNVEFILS